MLLTGCNMNNSLIKEDQKPSLEEGVVLNNEVKEEQDEPQKVEEQPDAIAPIEEEPPIEEEVVMDEPEVEDPVEEVPEQVEEPITSSYNTPLRSPVYRVGGTTNVETINLDVRSYEATITDSGRIHQKMDIVYLDYNYGGLEDLGYYWLDVRVTLTAREVHDGYQYLFLYNTTTCQSSGESLLENFIPRVGDSIKQGMLFKEQFEIGPGYKKTSWEERTFRFYVYVGNMVDNLYLRYGANGILSDTWINKDIKVSVTPKMTKN